jgi:hypothetical protein
MVLDLGFHGFDVVVRIIEESVFHPTPLYSFLDQNYGISAIDPLAMLGVYSVVGGLAKSAPLPPAPPALPALAAGGQRPVQQKEAVHAKIFG